MRGRRLARAGPPAVVFVIAMLVWYLGSYALVDPQTSFLLPPPHAVVRVAFGDPYNLSELLQALWLSARVAMIGLVMVAGYRRAGVWGAC